MSEEIRKKTDIEISSRMKYCEFGKPNRVHQITFRQFWSEYTNLLDFSLNLESGTSWGLQSFKKIGRSAIIVHCSSSWVNTKKESDIITRTWYQKNVYSADWSEAVKLILVWSILRPGPYVHNFHPCRFSQLSWPCKCTLLRKSLLWCKAIT